MNKSSKDQRSPTHQQEDPKGQVVQAAAHGPYLGAVDRGDPTRRTGSAQAARNQAVRRNWTVAFCLLTAVLVLGWQLQYGTWLQEATAPASTSQPLSSDAAQALPARAPTGVASEAAPQDLQAADRLVRSAQAKASTGRFQESLAEYRQAMELGRQDAAVKVDFAEAMAAADGRRLTGEPATIIQQALALDPTNVKAMYLLGQEAFDRRDYKAAVDWWQRAYQNVPAQDAPIRQHVQAALDIALRQLNSAPRVQAQMEPAASAPVKQPPKGSAETLPKQHQEPAQALPTGRIQVQN
jgi:cytochrome c-type biogenesis protein CcmH